MWEVRWYIMVMMAINHSRLLAGCLHLPLPGDKPQGGEDSRPPTLNETVPCPKVDAVKNRIEPEVKMFYVEHEVSEKDARVKIMKIEADNEYTSSGLCDFCGHKEMEYCAGEKVINDHCCCDRGDHENFPYVPHTCYLGNSKCNLIADNCEDYVLLRDCCCSKHLIAKWKTKLIKSSGTQSKQIKWLWILPWLAMMMANTAR